MTLLRTVVSILVLVAATSVTFGGRDAADAPAPMATHVAAPRAPRPEPAAASPVAAPVRIDIPAIGVAAPVDEIGLRADGTMQAPDDFGRAGWYRGLEAPGRAGTAVIVGHLDSYTGPAVFFELPHVRPGDEITVTRADATTVRFVVDRIERYRKDSFPTIAVYAPTAEPTLRLITCGGTFDRRTRHYSDNVVVYAQLEETT